jgi:NADH pyrophosphatase NudC (nudix superfamily)
MPFHFCPRCAAPLTGRSTDAEQRSACSAGCGFVDYDNPIPVVAAVVEHEGCIVLARNRAWPETWYALIAGFLERGEPPEQAVVREVREELGLDATAPALIGAYAFPRMNQVIIAYARIARTTVPCTSVSRKSRPCALNVSRS